LRGGVSEIRMLGPLKEVVRAPQPPPAGRADRRFVLALCLCVLLAAFVPSLATPAAGASAPGGAVDRPLAEPRSPASELPGAGSFPTPIRHVFTIFLENEERSAVLQHAPFEVKLAQEYASASNYYSVCHPSAPNYLAVTSGATWQCGSDAVSSHATENIGDLAEGAGLAWGGFFESMPSACDRSDSYPYIAHHNPFVYYPDLYRNASLCRAHDQSFTAWNSDVAAGTIPAYAFFAPNMTDDGHDTSTAYADHWLDRWLSPYLNASWFSSSVWFITWDEGTTNSGCCGFTGGHLFFTAVSPYTRGGAVVTTNATHYSLLSTTEWLLGLTVGACGHADNSSSYAPLKGLFNFSASPPSTFALHGTVSSGANGSPIAGARVTLGTGPATTSGAGGNYSFEVTNGSYLVTASAVGFVAQSAMATVSGAAAVQDFTLAPVVGASYPIVGVVTYALNGSPAVGATVGLLGGASTSTDVLGSYELSAPNGSYVLGAWQTGSSELRAPLMVAGAPVTENLALQRFPWNLTGTTVDATTGQSVVGARVLIAAGPPGVSGSNSSGPSGNFTLALVNGSYTLAVSAPLYRNATDALTVIGAPSSLTIPLHRIRPVYAVAGRVQFGNGTLVAAGVDLLLNSSVAGTTAPNGSFGLWAMNGTYLLSARAPGWYSVPVPITVAGIPLARVLVLVPFTFELSGVVTFANGSPVAESVVRLTPTNLSTVTTANGQYALDVPNGTYTLTVQLGGAEVARSTVVVDGSSAVRNVSVVTTPAGGTPTGSLLPIVSSLIGVAAIALVVGIVVLWRRTRRAGGRGPPPGPPT
jgi:phosphoesterase family protein/carboxypeptidase family protein